MEVPDRVAPIFKWQADEDDPKTNNQIILSHIAFKGAQAGSIFMTLFQLAVFRTRMKSLVFLRGQALSTTSLSLASCLAGYYTIATSDPVRNYDRAYRIGNNSMQNRCDKYSVMYGGMGLLLSPFLFPVPTWNRIQTLEKVFGVMCTGVGFGAVAHYCTKNGKGMDLIQFWRD